MNRIIRYFNAPAFTASQWSSINPYLNKGEVGYLIEGGVVTRSKVGPGYWDALGFVDDDVYEYSDAVTNPIGDAVGGLSGLKIVDVLKLMLSPVVAPAATGLINNAGGTYNNINTFEIGQSLAGPVLVNFAISNPDNLSGGTPINITAGGTFSNEGSFANSLPISLSLASPLAPTVLTTKTISVTLTHTTGVTAAVTTLIRFYPKIMWAVSSLDNMADGPTFMALSRSTLLAGTAQGNSHAFAGGGYSWIAIPSTINPTSPQFTDVTNPIAPANYSMEAKGSLSINNGVGTYNYQMYRSTFNLLSPTILKIT